MTKERVSSVEDSLRRLQRKLWLTNIVRHSVRGVLIGFCLAVLELVVARVIPIWYPWLWAGCIAAAGLAIGLISGLLRRVSVSAAARFADRHGLQERMVTALSFRMDGSPSAVVQREEALTMFHREEARILERVAVWRIPRSIMGSFALCLLLAGLLWWLPNPMQDVVKEEQQIKQALEKEQKKVAEAEEAIAKNEELSPEQKEELQQQLQQLQKQLAESNDLPTGMKALADAQAKLEQLAEEAAKKMQALENLRNQLASEAATKALADALEMDEDALREALEETREALDALSPEEKERLAAQLAEAANALEEEGLSGEEVIEALRQTAEHIRSGDLQLAMDALQNAVGQALANNRAASATASTASQTAQALATSKQALAQVGSGNHVAQGSSSSNNGISGNGATGQGNGSGSSNGNANSGNGNGNGPGSGTGNNPAAGTGPGSSSGLGSGAGAGAGIGSGAGLGSGSREHVSVPFARLDGGGPEDVVTGPLGNGADTEQSRGAAIGSPGVSRPYTEVFGQYEQAARKALERSDLPQQYQQLVKDYFTDIEPAGKE